MTLDEPRNHKHAAALERGENPENATTRTARLLARYDGDGYLSEAAWRRIAGRVVANVAVIADWVREDQPKDRPLLRRQRSVRYDDVDTLEEECELLERELRDKTAMLADARMRRVAEYDPDARGVREDETRERSDRQDERAREQAPKVAS